MTKFSDKVCSIFGTTSGQLNTSCKVSSLLKFHRVRFLNLEMLYFLAERGLKGLR